MSKNFSLRPLLNLAQQQSDAATKKLGQLNQQHQSAQSKLDALRQYRRDYQLKFEQEARSGMSPSDMKNFQDFIDRLDQAIRQQTALLEKTGAGVQHGRNAVMDATRKMKSFDALAQRHAEAEKKLESKLDQRMQDEHTGRFAANRAADKDDGR